MSEYIYLDWAAHTPADARVLQAFCQCEVEGNANSTHSAGRKAYAILEKSTQRIAEIMRVNHDEISYTSGASEANNLAIKGFAHMGRHIGRHIISTPLEHPSASGALSALQEQGYEVDMLNIGADGKIDIEHLSELLREDTVLASICAVDSEIGVFQPISKIRKILSAYPNCRLHVDAAQAVGKIPFEFTEADSICFSPHKFFGICGCGVLWRGRAVVLEPLVHGGGTPAVSLIASTAEALSIAYSDMNRQLEHVSELNQKLRQALSKYPLVRVNSPSDAIPHILNVSVKGVKAATFQRLLDENGICVSVKSACSTPNTPSRAVYAVSRDRNNALSSWRLSLCKKTTEHDVEAFLSTFDRLYKEI